ncbi:thiopeptide-type bacteriocin biosynthesis protein [Actinophytocola gossypii]|uniref:Thiopeptide-type bacteriocin biosynthesis protein n=1 Tax=Actinophytocola gossypii TaxID=2812003 RepID=A0ABT2J218_9PSEU|nr:thiopeptide-type bacteriocin biosynthesis protein [Actinophytocola gossypii]MCT2581902.1 thiopeptide-type bacteriocin biosynthesis protein [Actinophytocola gossypii]
MSVPVDELFARRPPWRHGPAADRWVQLGLAPGRAPHRELHTELAALVRDWRDRRIVEDFFFMHKPPGLRVRFAPTPGRAAFVRSELNRLVPAWRADGLVGGAEPGTYVPETHRFGGAAAMDHVHRLFTADATTWLDRHALACPAPAWALSLAMLRPVLDGLGLLGAEREVWAGVAAAGRLVPPDVERTPADEDLRRDLRRRWRHPDELLAALPDEDRALAERHAAEVTPLAPAWAAAVIDETGDVRALPEAAAWYVVFHWNRATLGFGRQAMLTEALLAGERVHGDAC